MLGRINIFWAGAGGFLALFCFNEIVAYHLSRTPKWLGGPLVYGAMVVGLLLGLSVMAFLGVEPEREAPETTPGSSETPSPATEGPGAGEDEVKSGG
jgi:hypothetical protein